MVSLTRKIIVGFSARGVGKRAPLHAFSQRLIVAAGLLGFGQQPALF
jgi:hypothetical protein